MFKTQITSLFESEVITTGYINLKKSDVDDATFFDMLKIKPGEINILLARVASFVKNDGQKSKKELINDILEVLERSSIARKFVGIGLEDNYRIFKGFPVRTGDAYETMPDTGSELVLKPTEVFISWTTAAPSSREQSSKYDVNKGEPIGGLVVETNIDSTKVLFDVNALIRVVKSKLNAIVKYNDSSAPGKAISKNNIDFLGTVAPLYKGQYEVITNSSIVNTKVLDKWTWNTSNGEKKIEWVSTVQPQNQEQPKPDVQQPTQTKEEIPQNTRSAKTQLQEQLKCLFESVGEDPECILEIDDDYLSEGIQDYFKGAVNWVSQTAGITLRGKTLRYIDSLIQMYEAKKTVYEISLEYDSVFNPESKNIAIAKNNIKKLEHMIQMVKTESSDIRSKWGDVASTSQMDKLNPDDISNSVPQTEPKNDDVPLPKNMGHGKLSDLYGIL